MSNVEEQANIAIYSAIQGDYSKIKTFIGDQFENSGGVENLLVKAVNMKTGANSSAKSTFISSRCENYQENHMLEHDVKTYCQKEMDAFQNLHKKIFEANLYSNGDTTIDAGLSLDGKSGHINFKTSF